MGQGNGSRRLKSQDMMPEPVRRTQLLGDEEWTAEIGSSRDGHADGCRRMPWDAFVDPEVDVVPGPEAGPGEGEGAPEAAPLPVPADHGARPENEPGPFG